MSIVVINPIYVNVLVQMIGIKQISSHAFQNGFKAMSIVTNDFSLKTS